MVRILFTIALALGGATLAATAAAAAPDDSTPVPTTILTGVPDDITIDTANPFLPENVDLSVCVGTLQRPGCGSSERGGWHQNLVAIVMVTGLLIVFGRVAWGVRRSQQKAAVSEPQPDDDADVTSTP